MFIKIHVGTYLVSMDSNYTTQYYSFYNGLYLNRILLCVLILKKKKKSMNPILMEIERNYIN